MKLYFLLLSLGLVLLGSTDGKTLKTLKRRRDVESTETGGPGPGEGANKGATCLQFWSKDNKATCGFYGKDEKSLDKYSKLLLNELKSGVYGACKWNLTMKGTDVLSANEARAVNCYTGRIYKDFNQKTAQLGIRNPDYRYKGLHYFLMRAYRKLSALPKEKKTFYRGVPADITSCKKGMVTHFDNFGSTSDDREVAEVFATHITDMSVKGTIFVINSDDGASINDFSQYKDEKEFLFSSCTRFVVDRVDYSGNYTYVFLSEEPIVEVPEPRGAALGVTPGSWYLLGTLLLLALST